MKVGTNDRMSIVAAGGTELASWFAKRSSVLGVWFPPDKPMGSRGSGDQCAVGSLGRSCSDGLVLVRVSDVLCSLSGFFFCFQRELLFVFDLFLFDLLVKVAPVAAGDDKLIDLELGMNALCPVKQICVERIGCVEPGAG